VTTSGKKGGPTQEGVLTYRGWGAPEEKGGYTHPQPRRICETGRTKPISGRPTNSGGSAIKDPNEPAGTQTW